MEHRIIPCVEGDDEFIADKINAITDSKIVDLFLKQKSIIDV